MIAKTLTLSCLLAIAAVQTASAQVLISNETDTTATPTLSSTTLATPTPLSTSAAQDTSSDAPAIDLPILSSAHVLVENNLEKDGAPFPFVVLENRRTAGLSKLACGRLGELLYSAQSPSLASVGAMLKANVPTLKEFYVDNGHANDSFTSNCDILTVDDAGKAIVSQGSCLRLLPSLCSNVNHHGRVTVMTKLGLITGARDPKGFHFKGIRYAKAPVGNLRFAAPQPITTSWLNTIDATNYGSMCPQATGGEEDCLFMNVFTPKLNANKSSLLPVMFYIHGGSFTSGTGSDPAFSPGNLSSRGQVVVVTFNYRLGVFGFFEREDAGVPRTQVPGNQGVRDMLVALKWVQDNVASFGGDPSRVTIFGESAGGHAVRTLLSMPEAAKGLFHAAISQSDPIDLPFNKVKTASTVVSGGLMTLLGCSDVACVRSKSVQEIMKAQITIVTQAIALAPEESFLELIKPTIDGILIKNQFDRLIAGKDGGVIKVPLIMGTMKDEAIGFLPSLGQSTPMPQPVFGVTLATILGYQRSMVTIGSGLYPIDPTDPDGTRQEEGVFAADYLWICPTQAIARAYAGVSTVYQHQFSRAYSPVRTPNDSCYNKVCHGDSVALMFASPPLINKPDELPWTADDAAMARDVIDRWTFFARTLGNPNPAGRAPEWPKYTAAAQNVYMHDKTPSINANGLRPQFCGFIEQYLKFDYQIKA
ncbi:hypothetical protein DFQ26_007158 [Actinomortierella ambigua]|nr:hypothetical protein DFQ26_007158 [Actinomortierella ambigua]